MPTFLLVTNSSGGRVWLNTERISAVSEGKGSSLLHIFIAGDTESFSTSDPESKKKLLDWLNDNTAKDE